MDDYAKRICDNNNKMDLTINIDNGVVKSQEQHLCDTNGESIQVFFSRPAKKLDEKDILKMEVTQADVLRVLNILLLKRKEDLYNLMLQVKKI